MGYIEQCRAQIFLSNMMDVYGHFTEPHPIFELALELLTKQPSFLLRFAKKLQHLFDHQQNLARACFARVI